MTCYSEDEKHRCRVCGLWREEPPWGENCDLPTFSICPCCGTEFGYEDGGLETVRQQRQKWLEGKLNYVEDGQMWFQPEERPEDWSVEEQLEKVPERWK
jgi:hypothetical protein